MDADGFFTQALGESQSFLRSVLSRFGHNRTTLDDLVQEANLRAWRHRAHFQGSDIRRWLFVVARHAAIDYFRSKRGRIRRQQPIKGVEMQAAPHHPSVSTEQLAAMIEAGDVLDDRQRRWFLGLRPQMRSMLLLAAAEGARDEDLAARMGIPVGTVKSQISRACGRAPRP